MCLETTSKQGCGHCILRAAWPFCARFHGALRVPLSLVFQHLWCPARHHHCPDCRRPGPVGARLAVRPHECRRQAQSSPSGASFAGSESLAGVRGAGGPGLLWQRGSCCHGFAQRISAARTSFQLLARSGKSPLDFCCCFYLRAHSYEKHQNDGADCMLSFVNICKSYLVQFFPPLFSKRLFFLSALALI